MRQSTLVVGDRSPEQENCPFSFPWPSWFSRQKSSLDRDRYRPVKKGLPAITDTTLLCHQLFPQDFILPAPPVIQTSFYRHLSTDIYPICRLGWPPLLIDMPDAVWLACSQPLCTSVYLLSVFLLIKLRASSSGEKALFFNNRNTFLKNFFFLKYFLKFV